ncbi:hypothetical protein A2757_00775 [Candidatus Giovannonibacteria bacterium RIFCSPHIGHO2_01_FULL_48_47]|nr:MAG: hypothetical protein A2757_00775 [Candidatus Giovannonibacteria bacterium RIFCSPHIGHO2_01_FULL_48_47]OGF67908.1 MAG: hypothetical protein A3D61_02320 [Candidatus Giovannonibacteria bacterium RIFCSPHIGHO2_02_FULL_48_15]OGF88910.1 MAG: hypothetical protein A3B26_01345 [Candidatus Giovannonibacteria bacterium RIFCSPLOWO2_01_FULL_48_47]OGF94496.1 MAG: hypothetical protein A2433_01265 [Candidatus Giovannonibacteria bacterium RIFOXYC1_FULL_48_8]OGF96033.1 MAG: hypothetical protein A2613_00470
MILGKNPEKFLKKFFSAASAQAFLLVGGDEGLENLLIRFLSRGAQTEFDLRVYGGDSLKIDEAREIHRAAGQSALAGAKIFLLKNNFIAPEAEATLLKTLEEPYPDTYFIISLASEAALSPPLLSRLTVFKTSPPELEKNKKAWKPGLGEAASLAKDRRETEDFFRRLEWWLEEKLQAAPREKFRLLRNFLEDLLQTKKLFLEKTYSSRMLLEHLIISKFYLEP